MVIPQITITKMQVGEFEVPVPHGLSELLNSAGAWKLPEQSLQLTDSYDRKVEKRDGVLVTILTKRNECG